MFTPPRLPSLIFSLQGSHSDWKKSVQNIGKVREFCQSRTMLYSPVAHRVIEPVGYQSVCQLTGTPSVRPTDDGY